MSALRWQNAVDFIVLAVAVYLVLRWGREARAFRVSLAIVALKAGSLLARQLDLVVTSLLLDGADIAAIILVLILYQSELRHALARLDVLSWLLPRKKVMPQTDVDAIAASAFSLARANCGALIVIKRHDPLEDLIDGGVNLGGEISPEILEAIFRKKSPVHDGATIIEGDHIARVGAILPLTRRTDIPKEFGTRHRAAVGLAERSDALITVVSEERGAVSVMYGKKIVAISSAVTLAAKIRELGESASAGRRMRLRQAIIADFPLKCVALAIALGFWSISFFLIGNSIRTITAPVEFTNVPPEMEISQLSADSVQIQVRGSAWLLDTAGLNTVLARFDLTGRKEGTQIVDVQQGSLNLPPGLVVENVAPRRILFNLISTAAKE